MDPIVAIQQGLTMLGKAGTANSVCRQPWVKQVMNQGYGLSDGSSQETGPEARLEEVELHHSFN